MLMTDGSIAASQQEGRGFKSTSQLGPFYVLPMVVLALSWYVCFLPQSKGIQVRLTGDSTVNWP